MTKTNASADLNCYLVGGAVRDFLLERAVVDRDWVVVGTRPEAMLARGFRQVGADFPVFLHPETQEEYALARTERKTAPGYHGFSFHAGPEVTLEDDLARRDLTINAIAQASDGRLVDPYNGQADLHARVLRHVAPAFVEDPLRVLRVARFAARFAEFGFRVAPETMALMQSIVDAGEMAHLTPERVFEELKKALIEPIPSAFLRVLRACGALRIVFPELDALYGVPQRAQFHPEIDVGAHQEMVSDQAAKIAPGDALVGFCALVHDLGKAKTPSEVLPAHLLHEINGAEPVRAMCERLRCPSEWSACALAVCTEHLHVHRLLELRPGSICDVFDRIDAWRKPDRVRVLALACEADKRGRLGLSDTDYPQGALMQALFGKARGVAAAQFVEKGLQGIQIGEALRQARIQVIAKELKHVNPS
jgi:tRNA nucleotidyltransferase (CCA-adding enzyme)